MLGANDEVFSFKTDLLFTLKASQVRKGIKITKVTHV